MHNFPGEAETEMLQPWSSLSTTRRRFLGLSTVAGIAALSSAQMNWAQRLLQASSAPLDKAYVFLDGMMDLYSQGSNLRLVQSYVPTAKLNLGDITFTYDDTLVVIALLQRGQSDDLSRAAVLGDSLVYAQTNDPHADGRVRNGYHVNPFVKTNGSVNISNGNGGSDTGNMAWTGMALVQLYHATNQPSYLTAALALGNFIQTNAYDTRGAGGYIGGIAQNQHKITYKSTEHNIDLFGFFTMLAEASGDLTWSQNAQHALNLVEAMWNAKRGFFWIGTGYDGRTINRSPIPEDVQTWSYLSTALAQYQGSIDWAAANLAAKNGNFSGVSFSNADTSGVWFEGTGHIAAALQARNLSGDGTKAAAYLQDIEVGQAQAPNTDGNGIVAASKDGLKTGDGDSYYAALHVGATSWYCLAKQAGNPFRFIR